MDVRELRDIFAEELASRGEEKLAGAVKVGADNSNGGLAAIAAMERALRRDGIGKFKPIVSIGIDKNGEPDFRVNMSIADLDRAKMDELTRMMPWALKEALEAWLRHGPPSKEMGAQKQSH